jgi:hypothetical protein
MSAETGYKQQKRANAFSFRNGTIIVTIRDGVPAVNCYTLREQALHDPRATSRFKS